MTAQFLVAGLGNLPMPLTRHSVGNLILDSLSSRLGAHLVMDKSMGGYYAETTIDVAGSTVSVGLFKPKALMNISGAPTAAALRKTAHQPSSLLVIHDSLDHRPTALSPKFGGSAGGHNGVRSVISALKTNDFHRLRVGIGRPENSVVDYVLGRLPSFERQYWSPDGPGIDLVLQHIENLLLKR
ncbi:peptidyl-tRNA hydrolase [Auriscalpium vulgare]|uniref:Peptidyl-tRNA hydrolase n=1 Tax=Auriscalpium vulgare TaxID=40419 RepID=A0ACB8RJD1_9AGAM|nr:peptidyl-tRNA hydrolase [Auriscalpium vulgare]